ncbi:hypothetical protein ACHAWF_002395 [Thalassiosira exigua]
MANAAAKKAAAGACPSFEGVLGVGSYHMLGGSAPNVRRLPSTAREAAAATYFPFVVGSNLVYLFLRLVYRRDALAPRVWIAAAGLVATSALSYRGILEAHAHPAPGSKGGSEALVGGASLDLLGLVVAVQYGTVLISEKFHWLLVLIPLWGGWKLYKMFFAAKDGFGLMPKGGTVPSDDANVDNATADKAEEKRRRRTERRRQKWS